MLETCAWILRKPNGTIRGRFSDSGERKIDDLKKSFFRFFTETFELKPYKNKVGYFQKVKIKNFRCKILNH